MDTFLADTTNLLRRTPVMVRALLEALPETWTNTPDVDGGWQPRDVVGHLISAELNDWMPRVRRILEHGTAQPFNSFDRFAHTDRDRGATLDELMTRFANLRTESLAALASSVVPGDLERMGLHASLGEVTLRELLATWSVHDLDHTSQIFAGLAGSRDADVGAWKAYLGILLRRDDPSAVPR